MHEGKVLKPRYVQRSDAHLDMLVQYTVNRQRDGDRLVQEFLDHKYGDTDYMRKLIKAEVEYYDRERRRTPLGLSKKDRKRYETKLNAYYLRPDV